MDAELQFDDRFVLSDRAFAQVKVWRVPIAVRGSSHGLKYSFALVVDNECVLRFDNEAGKGDHRHMNGIETPLEFDNLTGLLADFWKEVDEWVRQNGL
ncbi:MAG: DUF6516 family protein [Alphaproteobacteria bacterium]|nr:DUF6516 family protein [Alphaproteobacteria bacterium]